MAFETQVQQAAEILARSTHAVAFTGAGHSTPSGIPDFRSPGAGLWEQSDPMEVASAYAFRRNPQAFYDWLRPLAKQMISAQPSAGHHALADLERMGVLKAVITQNIDGLHRRAGSQMVLELHGTMRSATCTGCRQSYPSTELASSFIDQGMIPRCAACASIIKPDVVLFGDMLPLGTLLEAQSQAERCDVMLVAGSSLEVYPAADLPAQARRHGAQVVIVNLEPTTMDGQAAVVIHDDVSVILPQIARRVGERRGIGEA